MIHLRNLVPCTIVAVAACSSGTSQQPAPGKPVAQVKAPTAPVKKGPSVDEQTVGMVQASSPGKSPVPAELKFELATRPVLGEPLDVNIALVSQVPATAAAIQITPSDGLNLQSGAGDMTIPALEAAQVYRRTVSVTPTAEGVLFLSFAVTLKHDEISETRAFSVPIIVAANRAADAAPKH
jgi:hypothetical protein